MEMAKWPTQATARHLLGFILVRVPQSWAMIMWPGLCAQCCTRPVLRRISGMRARLAAVVRSLPCLRVDTMFHGRSASGRAPRRHGGYTPFRYRSLEALVVAPGDQRFPLSLGHAGCVTMFCIDTANEEASHDKTGSNRAHH